MRLSCFSGKEQLLFFGPGLFPFEFKNAPAPIVLCCALVVGLGVLGLGCSSPEKQDNLIDLLPKDEREVKFRYANREIALILITGRRAGRAWFKDLYDQSRPRTDENKLARRIERVAGEIAG